MLFPNWNYKKTIEFFLLGFVLGTILTFFSLSSQSDTDSDQNIIKHPSSSIHIEELKTLNPKIELIYNKKSISQQCIPGTGYIRSLQGPGINLLTMNNELIGVLATWNADTGWYEQADQPIGQPYSLDSDSKSVNYTHYYVQTLFFKPPPTAIECLNSLP